MRHINKGKAISYDGVSESIFQIRGSCCKNRPTLCNTCLNKINIAISLLDPNYWNSGLADKHLVANLIPLNKVHPNIPAPNQYRPIIVMSPVLKFLEGYIYPSLH